MHLTGRARLLFAFTLTAGLTACASSPPPPPPDPWLVKVTSIDSDKGAALTRCGDATCEKLAENAVVSEGATLRAERGARAVLALDASTDLTLANGAEIEIAHDHRIVLKRGAVTLARNDDALLAAPCVAVETDGRSLLVMTGPATLEVRAAEGDTAAQAIVHRGRATLTGDASERVLTTGEGARWRAGQPAAPIARWGAAGDDADETETTSAGRAPAARGLGTMTARVPGTNDVVSGVHLAAHRVTAEVRDGFARTTVEEEFANDTDRTLEGRFLFPLPPDASISRLALYVGDNLVEGEVVERPLAKLIFKAIVDDSVRPRDPALLELVSGGAVSLKVFPIPARGKRRVILAYDQAISEKDERVRYVYPLSFGPDRATTIDDFSISVLVKDSAASLGSAMTSGYEASLHVDEQGIASAYSAKRFAPAKDFVLRYTRTEKSAASLSWDAGPKEAAIAESKGAPAGYFALRLRADPPEGALQKRWGRAARAFVIDASHSQSVDTLDASIRVTKAALANLDPDDSFTVLACDSACVSYPEDGLAPASDASLHAATAWLAHRAAAGSSDVAGALLTAAERLSGEGGGQIVYLGDGVATSGELGEAAIRARVAPALKGLDAHFIGVGHSIDEAALAALASSVSGTYERLATGDPLSARAAEIARTLEAPVLRDARLVLPEGAFDVLPAKLPRVRLGQEIRVFGRFRPTVAKPEAETIHASLTDDADTTEHGPMTEVRLTGTVAGEPYALARSLDWDRALAAPSSAVHALWARAKIASLETSGAADQKEAVRLSTVHHVLSRATAMLVLENERMFVDTGVRAAIDRVLAQPAPLADALNVGPQSTARADAQKAAPFGMLELLNPSGAPVAPWGREGAGRDPLSAKGNMWDDDIGKSFGAGGLGLSGVGEGGGGRGEGTGLGSVGTIGHAAGTSTGEGQGFGSGHGRLGGEHKTASPRVRMGATSVSGRLPPEVIQRIVRQNFGRFRLCYEQGLRNNPNLQGRVAVRFVIDRQGSATAASNGGSDMPDSGVVSCVVRAFSGLTFPQPEAGIVTVVYPILFSPPNEPPSAWSVTPPWQPRSSWQSPQTSWPSWAPNPPLDSPIVTHQTPDQLAAPADDGALNKLLAQVASPEAPRSAHQALIRKLLGRGRFDDAFASAERYVGLDPDHEVALELYAEAAAATGRSSVALSAIDAQVEADPTVVSRHVRAASAFEAAGDERRACAHFRALASLPSPSESATYHALRCRARLGERAAALSEARAIPKPGALVSKLIAALEAGSAPAYEAPSAAGTFEVRVACSGEAASCPAPVIVGPTGTVVSPWTPAAPSSRSALSIAALASGTYRTLVTGEVPDAGAEVTVRVFGQSRTVKVTRGGTQLALASTVTLPQQTFGFN